MSPILPFAALTILSASPALGSEAIPDLASGIGQMVFGLAVVIALLLGSLWLIKRLSGPRGGAAGLKVLGAVPVGTRERVVMVEIADKVLVLGVTQASVNMLHTLDASEVRQMQPSPTTGRPPNEGGDFSRWLGRALDRRNGKG